jgi:hypothetical protein
MGHGVFSKAAFDEYSRIAAIMNRKELFHRSSALAPVRSGQEVNIEKIGIRESCDSKEHPLSIPLLIGLDVSGSMGMIAEYLAKQGLGLFVDQILQRKPIADVHLLFLAIGDAVAGDQAPLQATQFESDNRIVSQLTDLFLEGRGGGNHFESYDLAWAFAAFRCRTDAWEKRKQKGYLFTIGDECFPEQCAERYMREIFGSTCPQELTPEAMLKAAQERYYVFHIVITEGNYCRNHGDRALHTWQQRLQKRALAIHDYHRMAELLVSAIAVNEGTPVEDALGWWPQDVAGVLAKSLKVG